MGSLNFATLAGEWLGWRYPARGEQQEAPRPVSGWPAALLGTGTRRVDCSTFAAWMILAAYPDNYAADDYAALQIYDSTKPWSNVEWLLSRGIGEERAPMLSEWAYCQTWQGVPGKSPGHARLVLTRPDGVALCLESTESQLASGPQWRATTWADLRGRPACRAVVLR